ncbi:Smr/MutS family protein [Kiloniella laminariae]|uniref:Smr/MutS family protein n=2 Tax=Kiloniella laminariae TaxID=454162 RepID=A0ABT4LJA8_9PROT|nr:Smr/MutS family protein [Kiloniella laminariae]
MVSKTVKPLEQRDYFVFGRTLPQPWVDPDTGDDDPENKAEGIPFKAYRSAPNQTRPSKFPKQASALSHGQVHDMDRRQAERFTKGKLPLEAVLDLHGQTQAQAQASLQRFVASCRARDLRNVLVITGKGSGPHSEGVLKAMVPRWLNEEPNRSAILAFSHAKHHHGGSGALYVLLKRTRES